MGFLNYDFDQIIKEVLIRDLEKFLKIMSNNRALLLGLLSAIN